MCVCVFIRGNCNCACMNLSKSTRDRREERKDRIQKTQVKTKVNLVVSWTDRARLHAKLFSFLEEAPGH